MKLTAKELQAKLGGELTGDTGQELTGVNNLPNAGKGEITFADDNKYREQVMSSLAGLVIVKKDFPTVEGVTLLKVGNPKQVFSQIMQLFVEPAGPEQGIHETAVIHAGAKIADEIAIGEYVVIRDEVSIGRGSKIEAGSFIGKGVSIGEDCWIGPNVSLQARCRLGNRVILHAGTVIGADGFGYVWDGEKHAKIPQLGTVVIEDDVEIGSNSCVDRATFGETRIKRGTKLDNQVQIAHNVELGEHVAIAAQSGVAGSAVVKDRVIVGGAAAISDHVTVGEGAMVGGASGVSKDVAPGDIVWGIPAHNMKQVMKEQACIGKLPEMMKDLKKLIKEYKKE